MSVPLEKEGSMARVSSPPLSRAGGLPPDQALTDRDLRGYAVGGPNKLVNGSTARGKRVVSPSF